MDLSKNIQFKSKIIQLLFCDQSVLSFLLGILGILAGLGFVFINLKGATHTYFPEVLPLWVWGDILLTYALAKLIQVFYNVSKYHTLLSAIIGMWLWNFMFLYEVILDTRQLTPTELLLVVPVFCEVWSLIIIIYNSNNPVDRG